MTDLEQLIATWRKDADADTDTASEAESKQMWVTAGSLMARADQRRSDANELEAVLAAQAEGSPHPAPTEAK